MERNFNNRDFEQFVKQNADQYRMYPSEKVWKGVYSNLHTRRKWYGLGVVLLILASVVVTWMMVSSPVVKQQANNHTDLSVSTHESTTTSDEKSSLKQFFGTTNGNDNIETNTLPGPLEVQTFDKEVAAVSEIPLNKPSNLISETIPVLNNNSRAIITTVTTNNLSEEEFTSPNKPININIVDQATDNEYNPNQINGKTILAYKPSAKVSGSLYPMTIESVINSYKSSSIRKKIIWQFTLTPTISYRRLTENKSFLRNSAYASSNYTYASLYNVNSVVTHKPDMGFEVGLNAGIPLTANIKLRGGLQFNINRYGIKAFSYRKEVATIALNSSGGSDSLNQVTSYRNFNGYNSDWLQNFYFSVSAPVGIEFKFPSTTKARFGIAGTIQPTYIISDKAYLISTDYKNYVEVPWLVRRWNMNTGFEAFVSYSTAKFKWQIGPQVRYQLLSSFKNKYPVKENLFDFGLKLGITLNK